MGVYIEGMEMPKNCSECIILEQAYYCPFTLSTQDFNDERHEKCPLIEVPEPHGDLIDASEKIRVQMYDDEHEDFHTVEMTIDDLLSQSWAKAYAYPIIPASESKERPAFLPTYELTPRSEEG